MMRSLACMVVCLFAQVALATAASAGCLAGVRTAPPPPPAGFCHTAASTIDTDGDGYGNKCDADFDPGVGNCVVNMRDFRLFRAAFGTVAPLYDLDESLDAVGFLDFGIFTTWYKVSYGGLSH